MSARVLIAEDEDSILASLDFLMRRCGYETRMARDGEAALASLADFRPDLVLLDIMLPRVSGFEVCRAIRAQPWGAATRIMMITARSSAEDQAQGLQAGADAYLTKPFSTRDVVARARELLEAR